MKSFQKAFYALLFGLAGLGAAGATVSDVTARTRNGKVDIDYTIMGTDAMNMALAVTMIDNDTGKVHTPTEEGRHRITWDTAVEGLNLISSNVTATVSLVQYTYKPLTNDLYCVINLSGGPNAALWPVSYLSSVPPSGWTSEYKTTKLVLRRIEAGTFIMGGDQVDESHLVTLTKPFYIGIFEVTQRQWELVMGSWGSDGWSSSSYGRGDTYPAYYISYYDNLIRGSPAVDSLGFIGKMRVKTGIDFDLPTEAQWEYACRAGTTTEYYWGDEIDGAYAWYGGNSNSKTHPVGTKLPNAWGLYDMGGNVPEWCRDWYGVLDYGTDPKGPASGSYRVERGGSWKTVARCCASSDRSFSPPSGRNIMVNVGFRLAMTIP